MSTCTEAQRGMAVFKYLSRDTSSTKLSSSLLTPKEKVGVHGSAQSQTQNLIPQAKTLDFSVKSQNIIPAYITGYTVLLTLELYICAGALQVWEIVLEML